jgi:hypothetical protein
MQSAGVHRGSNQTIRMSPGGGDSGATRGTAGFPDLSLGFGAPAYHLSRDTAAGLIEGSRTTSGT